MHWDFAACLLCGDSPFFLLLGNEEFIKFSKVIVHPGYNKQTTNNDIALLKLSRPVKFTKYIRPACVPDANFAIQVGKKNFVSGFGTTSEGGSVSRVLKVAAVSLTLITKELMGIIIINIAYFKLAEKTVAIS